MDTLTRLYELTHHAATATHHHRILLLSSIVILHCHCSFPRSLFYDLLFVFFNAMFACFEDVFILRQEYGFVKSRNFIACDKYFLSPRPIKKAPALHRCLQTPSIRSQSLNLQKFINALFSSASLFFVLRTPSSHHNPFT